METVPSCTPWYFPEGQEIRFRLGRAEKVRHTAIDQQAFEALPPEVRALTWEDMEAATQEQAITGQHKPLKLTERQLHVFSQIATMPRMGMKSFRLEGVERGQPLPGGSTWDGSAVTTHTIWSALVKREVFELVEDRGSYQNWLVNPGPRLEEAVNLLLGSDVFPRDSIAYREALAFFRPGQTAPTGPAKRLKR